MIRVQKCCLCFCVCEWSSSLSSVASLQLRLHWACAGRRCAFDSSRRKRREAAVRADKQHTKRSPVLWNRTGRGFITGIGEFYVSLSWTQRYSLRVCGETFCWGECAVGAVFESMRSIQSCFSHGNQWWCGFSRVYGRDHKGCVSLKYHTTCPFTLNAV